MLRLIVRGFVLVLLFAALGAGVQVLAGNEEEQGMPKSNLNPQDKLVVLWTSGDPEVAKKMVFMYVTNAPRFDWWDDITLVVWGPSSKLLTEDQELQTALQPMIDSGVHLEACKGCSDMYGVSEQLEELGITVKYMGDVLTGYIKEGRHVLTI